jgi:small subunit ribosomal protein S3
LRADIDYACIGQRTNYGVIGIKVWIFKGEVYVPRQLYSKTESLVKRKGKK